MADITAETAAKRPFDEHRFAVLMMRVSLELGAWLTVDSGGRQFHSGAL
jgi:hypothetical protein